MFMIIVMGNQGRKDHFGVDTVSAHVYNAIIDTASAICRRYSGGKIHDKGNA